ncbi:MAG: hypothetical protein F2529_01355 [Actinobacteria bacterium]|uniref:Unannotated protein n=1 Tax=freshwater metagenome TaxID=449393 RepID=A0A6J6GM37_9ZZZZ|nr:hypothetical protein [Actinomycetota bacterium]MTA29537.1 hypothetical protein [Actinomycetota bacterium]
MLNAPRWLLALVSILFGLYHAILGASAWRGYVNILSLALSIAIYMATMVISVVASKGLTISRGFGSLVAIGAVATVIVANSGIQPGHSDPYSTWYVGGMSALLGVLAARGQSAMAWISAALVSFLVVVEDGLEGLGEVGIEGMAILIAAASATAFALKRADREVVELQNAEMAAEAAIIGSEAAGEERKVRLQNVLERSLNALGQISVNRGAVTKREKEEFLQLESSLRDDIRGRALLNPTVRKAASEARARGIDVLILDEGGLSLLPVSQLEHILEKVAGAINSVVAGKVVVRSPRGEKWVVTVMATRPGTEAPDLWLKF